MPSALDLVAAGAAAVAAGAVNALAGGGSLITFPTLVALGVPAVAANVTNTVALCPGYLGGALAQARDLAGQRARLARFLPVGVLGGVTGGALLLASGERAFRALVPFLILGASMLLALQDRPRAWLARGGRPGHAAALAAPLVGVTAVYGGYFGAGMGVMVLTVLGLCLDDTLTRLNALKQSISLAANVAAALFFVGAGHVAWPFAAVMAVGALAGGALGGHLAGRVPPAALRVTVVTIGLAVGVVYLLRA
jgi:hypothetical protein